MINKRPAIVIQTRDDEGRVSEVHDVAISSNGEVYTTYNYQCHVYTADGRHVRQFKLQGGDDNPYITVAADGSVLVADYMDVCIYVYSGEGDLIREMGGKGELVGILRGRLRGIVTHGNNVYVANEEKGSVYVFTLEGEHVRTLGEGLLGKPVYLAFNHKQELMVSDWSASAIFWFDRQGKLLRQFRGDGEKVMQHPWGVCEDASGNLLVAIHVVGPRLDVFTNQFKYRCTVEPRDRESINIRGLAVTKDGKIVAVNSFRKEILIM